MALPNLLEPSGLPYFLLAGHSITAEPTHDDFEWNQGHGRKRKVFTAREKTVNVSRDMSEAQADVYDDWLENALQVLDNHFTAHIATLGLTATYWDAQFVSPPQWTPRPVVRYNPDTGRHEHQLRWRLDGQLLLTGQGEATAPTGTDLAVEYVVLLDGSATIASGVALEVEYDVQLNSSLPLEVEYLVALLPVVPGHRIVSGGDGRITSTGDRRITSG